MTSRYPIGAIIQEIALIGDGKGWYPCNGEEVPKELTNDESVMSILEKYGHRLPDLRPGKWFIYLGGIKC